MKIKLSKKAIKFLENINNPHKQLILDKLKILYNATKTMDIFLLQNLNIKALNGDWKGYYRIRVGNIRIIFKYDFEQILIEDINYRGKIY